MPASMDGAQPSADEHGMGDPHAAPLFFVQVRPPSCGRWTTHAVAGAPEVAARGAQDWKVPAHLTGADYRVVSDRDLEREGGIVAVVEAVASLHAQALRACRWLPVADEVVGPAHMG